MIDSAQLLPILDEIARDAPVPLMGQNVSVFRRVTFAELDDCARCQLAKFFIIRNCPGIGAFAGNFDAPHFIACTAEDVATWPMGKGHANRRLDSIAYALDLASAMSFASPQGALSAVYLLHHLEFFFRALSGMLHPNGSFIDAAAMAKVKQQLSSKNVTSRISDIAVAYKIMLLNSVCYAAQVYREIDAAIPPVAMPDGKLQKTIGDRVTYFRHTVSHGEFGDPSSEGLYYSLLTAIAIYGSTLFDRT